MAGVILLAVLLAGCMGDRSPGERLYGRHCDTCHGPDGGGGIRYLVDEGANLIDGIWKLGGDAASIEMAIRPGGVWEHPPMDLTEEEIRQLADHVLALGGQSRR